jgi:hypothetical protein
MAYTEEPFPVNWVFLRKSNKWRMNMEKQFSSAAYWLGIISSVLALITRGLSALGVVLFPVVSSPGKIPISYRSFLDGAILFFTMAIASSVTMWAKSQKS